MVRLLWREFPEFQVTRIPKLQLPHFKGDVTKWNSFWDGFDSAIHSNGALNKIDKYNYLNSLLEGPAARAVQGLTLTEANYDSAIELLKSRFGKPQQVIMHQSILALPIPPPGNPRAFALFFFFKLTIPGGRAGKAWQCPAPGQKKDDKCPAPGHTDSFIECILDLQTSIILLASLYKSYSSHPNF